LGLTLLIEVPVYAIALGKRAVIPAVLVNLLTHPLLWFALSRSPGLGAFVLGELVAWTVEFGLLWCWLRRDPLTITGATALANALSCLAGLLVSFL
jgi:hypothetical protein